MVTKRWTRDIDQFYTPKSPRHKIDAVAYPLSKALSVATRLAGDVKVCVTILGFIDYKLGEKEALSDRCSDT